MKRLGWICLLLSFSAQASSNRVLTADSLVSSAGNTWAFPSGSASHNISSASLPVTLTASDAYYQYTTGSTAGDINLPAGSAGMNFFIVNGNTSNTISVKRSGSLVQTLQVNQAALFYYANSAWNVRLLPRFLEGDTKFTAAIRGVDGAIVLDRLILDGFYTGADQQLTLATSPSMAAPMTITFPASNQEGYVVSDNSGNLSFVAPPGLHATVSSGTTLTLTATSKYNQQITGSTTQLITLPVVSTLPYVGFAFKIINSSSGTVTVQSSGGNTISTVSSSSSKIYTCVSLSGTGTSSWVDY